MRRIGPTESAHLLDILDEESAGGRGVLLTGPRGAGKTQLLRTIATVLRERGASAPVLTAHTSGRDVPMGLFLGAGLGAEVPSSPAEVVAAYARRRSHSVLLVDGVEHADTASLFVILKLVQMTRLPAVLAATVPGALPESIRQLCDSGDLALAELRPLNRADAIECIEEQLGGMVTPAAASRLVAASRGNPLQLRELVAGSRDAGELVESPHGWDLRRGPVPTPRLAQSLEERLAGLSTSAVEAAMCVAFAGEYPAAAIDHADRRALAHVPLIEPTTPGWLRLTHRLDGEYLRSRAPAALRHDLIGDVIGTLRDAAGEGRADARIAADALAVDNGYEVDPASAVALAEHALGGFDERLALHAAQAALAVDPANATAHRLMGSAASALGDLDLAEASFRQAQARARTDAERTAVALAVAEHLGTGCHDAAAALAVVTKTELGVSDDIQQAHLAQARMRWGAVSGHAGERVPVSPGVAGNDIGPETALSLITATMGSLISGPFDEAERLLSRLRRIPQHTLALVPGGAGFVGLAEAMALSYSGDVVATRRRLHEAISSVESRAPETIGAWEYALGLLELLSADPRAAYQAAQSAATHLEWRDTVGLLPAAHALAGAAAAAARQPAQSEQAFDRIPRTAVDDPKVVMLCGWARAHGLYLDGHRDDAGETLLETAEWMLTAQHTYYGGMLAHCVARLGYKVPEATKILRRTASLGGGAMLELLLQHAEAVCARDDDVLDALATAAAELGLVATAVDIWTELANRPAQDVAADLRARRSHARAAQLMTDAPGVPLWAGRPDRSSQLTERERDVANLAAQRLTTKEIAGRHDVSPHTVTNQLAAIYRKLGVKSRAELRDTLHPGGSRSI